MPSYQIKNSSTVYPLVFFMVDSADHITGKTGLTVTVTLSKAGGAFASPSGAVSEIANGWYKVAGNATDSNTNGPLALHATATGADPSDTLYEVVAVDPQDAVRLGLSALPNAAAEAAGGLYTRGTGAGQINQDANGRIDANLKAILGTVLTETSGQIAAAFKKFFDKASPTGTINSIPDAVAGAASGLAIVGSNMGTATSVSGAVGSVTGNVGGNVTGSVGSVTGNVGGNVTGSVGSVVGLTASNLDAAVSTRLAAGSYTAPDNATISAIAGYVDTEVAAIKAKTDNLPASPAATADIPTAAQNAAALLDLSDGIETSITPRQAMRLILAALAGKLSGAGGTTITIRNVGDSKNRITATVDSSGNRSAVTTDGT